MTLAHDRSGSGEPLVCVHGFGSNRHVWNPVLPLLEGEREVIRVDLPGFGETPPLPDDEEPSPQRLARAVAAFVRDELGIERPHVAGNSMGGWIALELMRTGDARSACALSPAGFWNRWERLYSRALFTQVRALVTGLRRPVEAMYRTPAGRRAGAWQFMDHADRMPLEDGLIALRDLRECPGYWPTWRALHTRHVTGAAEIDGTAGPITIAWAEHDRVLLPKQAERARRALPRARHVWLAGCGHVPTYDDPELIARTILTSA